MKSLIQSKPPALQFADSDNLLTNPRVLDLLMAENLTLVAPMMESRSLYSNFWCGVTPQVQLRQKPAHLSVLSELPAEHGFMNPLSGLLQAHPGLPANQGVEEARLFPCSHGAQHLPFGPSARIQPRPGVLPTSSGLQLGL